jgi:hypothetical protein
MSLGLATAPFLRSQILMGSPGESLYEAMTCCCRASGRIPFTLRGLVAGWARMDMMSAVVATGGAVLPIMVPAVPTVLEALPTLDMALEPDIPDV